MTVSSEANRAGPYQGNGATTVFAYGFKIIDSSHIKVIRSVGGVGTTLVLGADYSVYGVGSDGGGSVTLAVAPTSLQSVILVLNIPFTQEIDLINQGSYFAETVETGFDLSVMRDKQIQEQVDRALLLPVTFDQSQASELADGVLALKPYATEISVLGPVADDIGVLSPHAAEISVLAGVAGIIQSTASALYVVEDVFTADGTATTFTLSTNPVSKLNVDVFANGLIKKGADYSVAGTTLSIPGPLSNGVVVVARTRVLVSANDVYTARDGAVSAKVSAEAARDTTIAALGTKADATNGTLTTPTLILKQTGGAHTAEGDIRWDPATDFLVVGTGSAATSFRPNAWELINTVSFGATISSITQNNLSAFETIRLTGNFSNDANSYPLLQLSQDNGSTYFNTASHAAYGGGFYSNNSATGFSNATLPGFLMMGGSQTTNTFYNFEMTMRRFNKAQVKRASHRGDGIDATGLGASYHFHTASVPVAGNFAANAFRLIPSSGGWSGGILYIEGIRG